MTTYPWVELLTQWSSKILASDHYRQSLPPGVINSRWLGFKGATEARIAKAEARSSRVARLREIADGRHAPAAFDLDDTGRKIPVGGDHTLRGDQADPGLRHQWNSRSSRRAGSRINRMN